MERSGWPHRVAAARASTHSGSFRSGSVSPARSRCRDCCSTPGAVAPPRWLLSRPISNAPMACDADVVVPSGSESLRPSTTAPLLGRRRLPQPHRLRKQHGDGAPRNPSRVDWRTAGTMQQSAARDETTPSRSKQHSRRGRECSLAHALTIVRPCRVARLLRAANRTAEFSPRRQRTTRRARPRNVDRPEVRLAMASSPSRSPWLAPRRCAQRPNLRHVGWRSSWHRDLQLASVQPQRSPPHESSAQDIPTGRHLLDVRSNTLADSFRLRGRGTALNGAADCC